MELQPPGALGIDSPPHPPSPWRSHLSWGLATLTTGLALLILFAVPEPIPGQGPLVLFGRRWYLSFPNGIIATLCRGLLMLRLLALLWEALTHRLLSPATMAMVWQRLGLNSTESSLGGSAERSSSPDTTEAGTVRPPWETFQWSSERWLLAGVLLFTILARLIGSYYFNPNGLAMGSDAHTFIDDAWAVSVGDWNSYNQDKYPLYPTLSALMGMLLGGDFSRGCQVISWLSMTFSAPFLYLALRLSLGRATALGACAMFAVSAHFQYYANATTVYGILTGCTLLSTGLTVAALNLSSHFLIFLTGLSYAVGYTADVKFLTISSPLLLLCLLHRFRRSEKWHRPIERWFMLLLPTLVAILCIQHFNHYFTPLAQKFEFQRHEIARFFLYKSQQRPMEIEQLPPGLELPSLLERLQFNLTVLATLAPMHWHLMLGLFLLGCVAGAFTREGGGWRDRLRHGRALLVPLAVISSLAGALTMLYLPKYGVHAMPYVFAVILFGGNCLITWLAPPLSPPVIRFLMSALLTGVFSVMAMCGKEGLEAPRTYRLQDVMVVYTNAAYNPELVTASMSRTLGEWISQHVSRSEQLLVCAPVELSMAIPRSLLHSGRREMRQDGCTTQLSTRTSFDRYWLVDARPQNAIYQQLANSPERYEKVYSMPFLVSSERLQAEIYLEHGNGQGTAPETLR